MANFSYKINIVTKKLYTKLHRSYIKFVTKITKKIFGSLTFRSILIFVYFADTTLSLFRPGKKVRSKKVPFMILSYFH